jgi:hypothetical protein
MLATVKKEVREIIEPVDARQIPPKAATLI